MEKLIEKIYEPVEVYHNKELETLKFKLFNIITINSHFNSSTSAVFSLFSTPTTKSCSMFPISNILNRSGFTSLGCL